SSGSAAAVAAFMAPVAIGSQTNGGSGHPIGQWRFAGFGFSGSSFCVAGSVSEKLCAQRFAFPAKNIFNKRVSKISSR
ncbi:MAG: hypothetical protein EBS63_02810, partial [Burkholderiaceae bacterium]|nr:hypothetical protein [Burkholderiaceae bacterium]